MREERVARWRTKRKRVLPAAAPPEHADYDDDEWLRPHPAPRGGEEEALAAGGRYCRKA